MVYLFKKEGNTIKFIGSSEKSVKTGEQDATKPDGVFPSHFKEQDFDSGSDWDSQEEHESNLKKNEV